MYMRRVKGMGDRELDTFFSFKRHFCASPIKKKKTFVQVNLERETFLKEVTS